MNGNMERLKIAVVGVTENSGSDFVSINLVRFLREHKGIRPSLIEIADHSLFDVLAMGKYFAHRDFFSFFEAIKNNESIRGKKNELFGVNWALRTPWEEKISFDLIKDLRLTNNISGNVSVSLMSRKIGQDVISYLNDMEMLVAVIDPLPSKLLQAHEFMCELRMMNIPIIYVINRMNKGISKRELLNYLKLKKLHYLPMIEAEHIYGAEYSCKHPYDLDHIRKQIDESFKNITKEILSF